MFSPIPDWPDGVAGREVATEDRTLTTNPVRRGEDEKPQALTYRYRRS